jgi:hypothetical protein
MKSPFTLVTDALSNDVGEVLGQLIQMHADDAVIGLAFVVMLKHRKYYVNVAGEAFRNPTFARGCVHALDDELGLLARGKSNNL